MLRGCLYFLNCAIVSISCAVWFSFSSTISHNKWNILIKGKLRTHEIASDRKKDQKRIHIPVHGLCWNFFRKMFPTFSFKLFLQTAPLRCFARFWIRFWGWMQITITLPLTKHKGAVRLWKEKGSKLEKKATIYT